LDELKSCVAIDPSINNCGVSVFFDNELAGFELLHPSPENTDQHYTIKARDMANKVRKIYQAMKLKDSKLVLVTEIPDNFGISGYIARETGSVMKLTFVCGMIFAIAEDAIGYMPRQWKCQLKKEVVRNRLVRKYPNMNIDRLDHNIVDAIGIGHKYIFNTV
jgi:hypothetical protein